MDFITENPYILNSMKTYLPIALCETNEVLNNFRYPTCKKMDDCDFVIHNVCLDLFFVFL